MKIKALIIEDEKIAREVLANYLAKYCPQVEILDMAENYKEAVAKIKEWEPQLIFLDVEMPYGNAFDVLEATANQNYQTIFVTAFADYSLKALNMSAAYYLLKPIDIEELITAVNKVMLEVEREDQFNHNATLLENLRTVPERQQLVLPTQNGFDVVKLDEVIRLQADGNFVKVFLQDGSSRLVCRFLKYFEELLDQPFMRVHRSHIVNLNYVKAYTKGNGGTLTMQDRMEIEVSPSYKNALLERF